MLGDSTAHNIQSLKRPHDAPDFTQEQAPPAKRVNNSTRLPQGSAKNTFSIGLEDPSVLPPPTLSHVTLRLQLVRFKVWRIVHVPTNYTLKHLHHLLQFLFGWEGSHAHTFEVQKHVEMYATKTGVIKEGNTYIRTTRRKSWFQDDLIENNERHANDNEVTLAQIWKDTSNASRAIIYEYDISSPWTIHITINTQRAKARPARQQCSSLPYIVRAKGAPPTEDGILVPWSDEYLDEDADSKAFDKEQFNGSAFQQYLKGELEAYLNEDALVACTSQQKAKLYKETMQRRRQMARDIMTSDEGSGDEEGEDFDEVWADGDGDGDGGDDAAAADDDDEEEEEG